MSAPHRFTLDPDAARALDAAAMERLAMPGLLLMEHAAIGVAAIVDSERRARGLAGVLIACGTGGNGGDGWAVARLLVNAGVDVIVVSIGPARPESDAAINETITRRLAGPGLVVHDLRDEAGAMVIVGTAARGRLVVDALFGVGLTRPVGGVAATVIEAISESRSPIVAIDVPSGLDAGTGRPLGPCVRADITATMVAPKTGMLAPEAATWTGRIEIVDIGTPPALLREFGRVAGSAPVGDDADIRPADVPR